MLFGEMDLLPKLLRFPSAQLIDHVKVDCGIAIICVIMTKKKHILIHFLSTTNFPLIRILPLYY